MTTYNPASGCIEGNTEINLDIALDHLAPSGSLRVALNFGNPVLVQRSFSGGQPQGVTVAIANELGRRLGVDVRFLPYESAGMTVAGSYANEWDLAFLAVDPAREESICFSDPYVIIRGCFLVPENSAFSNNKSIDQTDVRIAVGDGAAYDLFLTRSLRNAVLERVTTSQDAINLFLEGKTEVAAGVRIPLTKIAGEKTGVRVLEEDFMLIRQAVAVPKSKSLAMLYLNPYINELKASGFIQKALESTRQFEAEVAP
jgi:polar amino acid transport system substrate-binding protein